MTLYQMQKLHQIELERSASSQWETLSECPCPRPRVGKAVAFGGEEKDGTEEEGIFVVGGHTCVRTRTSKEL